MDSKSLRFLLSGQIEVRSLFPLGAFSTISNKCCSLVFEGGDVAGVDGNSWLLLRDQQAYVCRNVNRNSAQILRLSVTF